MRYDDEDYIAELKQQAYEERKMWRNLSCADGFCGAEDCWTCRPNNFQAEGEDDENM